MSGLLEELNVHDNQRTERLLSKAYSSEYSVCIWGAGEFGTGHGKRILDEYHVLVDYYCDNKLSLVGTEIVSGIYCREADELIKNAERTICFLFVGYPYLGTVYQQLIKAGVRNIVTYNDLLALPEVMKKYLPYLDRKDIAVYTCITGDYDDVREPRYISDRCDYFLISDKEMGKESVYKWLDVNEFLPPNIENPIYQNRYCKMNAHKIFPEYRYSVYIDGNITITGDITENVDKLKRARIGVACNVYADNIYQHGLRYIQRGMALPEKLMNQLEHYWLQGLPEDSGLFFCNVLVREHNNPICIKLMEDWWNEFCAYSRRDQISFPYVLWKNGFAKDDVLLLCDSRKYDAWVRTPYWEYEYQHKKKRL